MSGEPKRIRAGIVAQLAAIGLCVGALVFAWPFFASMILDWKQARIHAQNEQKYGRVAELPAVLKRYQAIDAELKRPSTAPWAGYREGR